MSDVGLLCAGDYVGIGVYDEWQAGDCCKPGRGGGQLVKDAAAKAAA
ncbi:hypothetical protein [Enterobacter hormaechei]|nr:hypothetical protein [Enterobacter hormaechei]EKS6649840.1 hypothetical protein [Enterobacter hormaechei]WNJ34750.1 hypothetical protein RMN59_21205 [Enterobacter hormaechei subsp. hormaechei]